MDDPQQILRGVRGWLLLLVVILTLIGPLRSAWEVHSAFDELAKTEPGFLQSADGQDTYMGAWFVWAVTSAISFAAGMLLAFRFRRSSIWWAIAAIWLVGPVLSTAMALDAYAYGEVMDSEYLIALAKPFGFSIIWTAYLLMSKRATNTYPAK